MKICPMCGADVFGAGSGSKCTSCGADLEETIRAKRNDATDVRVAASGDDTEGSLDDSAPIKPADDLELVQSGHAFWAEQSAKEEAPATPPSEPEPEPEDQTEKSQVSRQLSVFTDEKPRREAPSLADLARTRKADLGSSGDGDSEHDAHDDTDSVQAQAWSQSHRDGEAAAAADADLDDTHPNGLKANPTGEPRKYSSPDLKVVSRSPDVAFIEGNKLVVPGATWSSGETVVLSGRTFELRRRIAKYPFSTREMLIGTGSFLVGCLIAWMLAAGGDGASSRLYGVVRDTQTGKLLPGVTVALEDQNLTAESDPTGMFHLAGLTGGIYTLVATDPIYGKSRKSITVAGDATSVLLELERPSREPEVPSKPPPRAQKPKESVVSAQKPAAKSSSKKSRGKLAVTASVPNARIYLDGNLLGVGNSVYSGIRTGKRKLKVVHDGFDTWQKTITVAGGETLRIEPQLQATPAARPEVRTPEQYASTGRKYIENREYKLALEQFNAALSESTRPQYLVWRAEAYVGLKELHLAEADYLQAIYLFRDAGENKQLDDLLDRAVLVIPASAPLWSARGEYLYANRKLKGAVKSYRRALEMGGDAENAYTGIGLAQYAGGSFDDAVESWELADRSSGETSPHLAGYLALAHARLQHRTSCRAAVRRLLPHSDVLEQFRGHPDWSRVTRLTGQG